MILMELFLNINFEVAWVILVAVFLDCWLGEPRRFHPLVGFGCIANYVQEKCYGRGNEKGSLRKIRGIVAIALLIFPVVIIALALSSLPYIGLALSALMLYLCLGHKSLHDHAIPVVTALQNNNEKQARHLAGQIVSRDTKSLDIVTATTESVLENGNDAVFGAVFWFVIAGAPGAILYRLSNTLDAMWGYRNDQYYYFGWAAARLDDLLNYFPARLTALTYAFLGKTKQALFCWRTQASTWESPNAGSVMAAGAGALGISIGGAACYQGKWHQRPVLGAEAKPETGDIQRALNLIRHGVWLWVGVLFIVGVITDGRI